ncbi:hypothetical protein [Aurantimonas sp. VKM B-3413]|uniref:hypothetical protein n=1 Tax=Aurantimonas sp. VKM B-3413 TaxID=2779401 RepID=UPI001E5F54A9|nr:hypothetical protein [Aurantimonas sp. VKM B-3413]MCB8837690.1 hypothetical protein [Aurantimonas sp. VKM B-3413]
MPDGNHSTAFEQLIEVDNIDDDVVGHLAYAYYKRDKRELALKGDLDEQALSRHHLTLTPRLIQQYRDSALLRLESYAGAVLDRSRPQIQEETRVDAIYSVEERLSQRIRSATAWWQSIVWNVVAWLITLAVTFLVLASTGAVSIKIGGT